MTATKKRKLGHDSVSMRSVYKLKPSPENDKLYKPVDSRDPAIAQLGESIRERGFLEPLVVTADDYIVSGHRRYAAAMRIGRRMVPCRILPFRRIDDLDRFVVELREHNRQRDKSLDEKLREELVSINPDTAHQRLREHRNEESAVHVERLKIYGTKKRCSISKAKQPFLDAISKVIYDRRKFWPLTDRRIHYSLLSDPPLKHANKPDSRYANDRQSYKALVELLTRARLVGEIPWRAIADSTRPVTTWQVYQDPREFVRREFDGLLKNYWRDLMRSQPNHIEIIGEKNTIDPILRAVAGEYTIPLTTGRGYCSLPPRYEIAQRFEKSGKEKLVLLLVSDFDPDGEEIAASFARSMRDDFGIKKIHPVKVALTASQVEEFDLPPVMTAKESSVHHDKFVDKYGTNVWELEALEESDLQDILREAIDSVIDIERFNAEVDAERTDAAWLTGVRNTVQNSLKGIDIPDSES